MPKLKQERLWIFFYQHYCCDTAPEVSTYGAGSYSEGCSLMERCFACLLWHLQYFPYRGLPLCEADFHPEEVSSPSTAVVSRTQETNRSVFSVAPHKAGHGNTQLMQKHAESRGLLSSLFIVH